MGQEHYTYRTVPPQWRDCNLWSVVSTAHLDDDARARFDRLAKAIRIYLTDGSLKKAADAGQCSRQTVLDKLNRCLTLTEDLQIAGWRGLLSHERLGKAYRRKTLPEGEGGGGAGASGAFERFLELHEKIRNELHKAIRRGGAPKGTTSRLPTLRSVYARFREACKEAGLTVANYPLNFKNKGRRSVERYVVLFIRRDPDSIETWYGANARAQASLGTGKKSFQFGAMPFDHMGMDAHQIHCIGTVIIGGPAGPQPVPIKRLWIVPLFDHGSRVACGYSVAIRDEISAGAIEAALVHAAEPWQPRKLSMPNFRYPPGAALPVGNVGGLTACRPSILQIDNAAQHLARTVTLSARRALGCAICFGPVGAWWRNAFTERLFRTLELYGFQRLSSSTGSNSQDVHVDRPVQNAIRQGITWEELIDLVDVLFASYNATPQDSLGGQTPLEVLRAMCGTLVVPRPAIPLSVHTPALGTAVEVRRIAGSAKKGSCVAPYVEIDEARYTCPALSNRVELIGSDIVVHIKEADMTVRAFLPNGEDLGMLVCLHPGWKLHPHTREFRKLVNAHIRDGDIRGIDPITEYMQLLAKRTQAEARRNPTKVSPSGTQLAEASRTTGVAVATVAAPVKPPASGPVHRTIPAHIKRPQWSKT